MSRFRLLNGVAAGLADSFIGRNNDIGGYWAMGLLYRSALRSGDGRVILDLLSTETNLGDRVCRTAASTYSAHLQRLLEAFEVPSDLVSSATISAEFGRESPEHGWTPRRTAGDPFLCTVTLSDSRNREHVARRAGWCRPHDWRRESRSARVSLPLSALSPDQLSQLLFAIGSLDT